MLRQAIVLLLSFSAPSVALAAESAQAALNRFLDRVQTLEARFSQVQTDDQGRADAPTTGRMALSRPGRFFWEYLGTDRQVIVTDGKTLWLYDQGLQQVTERPAEAGLQGTPAALLSQRKALTDAFNLSDDGEQAGIRKLRLVPKKAEGDYQDISLWLNPQGAPVRMVFRDQLGGSTEIAFSDLKTNAPIADARFQFVAPKGVEVIRE